MATLAQQNFTQLLLAHQKDLLGRWIDLLKADGASRAGRVADSELRAQCRSFLDLLVQALRAGDSDADDAGLAPVLGMLDELSRSRATQGFSPRETALFVFSLKQPLFDLIAAHGGDANAKLETSWAATVLLDRLGLHTMETFQKTREEVIHRQAQEISELSTPVIKLWDGVLALPLIGTLDSERTQVVMESLLEAIVAQRADVAIIDITGVPTVDTLTAQHLLKTVAAARLMGADCLISGIRPQIAQTMVHLGVELSVVSKATLADAFALALARRGRTVTRIKPGATVAPAADRPLG